MLEIEHLTKRFNGIPAVEDVSFPHRPGEILGYVGPNGAGQKHHRQNDHRPAGAE